MNLTFTYSLGPTKASTAGPILTSGQTLQPALSMVTTLVLSGSFGPRAAPVGRERQKHQKLKDQATIPHYYIPHTVLASDSGGPRTKR